MLPPVAGFEQADLAHRVSRVDGGAIALDWPLRAETWAGLLSHSGNHEPIIPVGPEALVTAFVLEPGRSVIVAIVRFLVVPAEPDVVVLPDSGRRSVVRSVVQTEIRPAKGEIRDLGDTMFWPNGRALVTWDVMNCGAQQGLPATTVGTRPPTPLGFASRALLAHPRAAEEDSMTSRQRPARARRRDPRNLAGHGVGTKGLGPYNEQALGSLHGRGYTSPGNRFNTYSTSMAVNHGGLIRDVPSAPTTDGRPWAEHRDVRACGHIQRSIDRRAASTRATETRRLGNPGTTGLIRASSCSS